MSEVVDIHKRKGIRPDYDVYIGRNVRWTEFTRNTKWANLFYKRLDLYEEYIRKHLWEDLDELKGKILGCWCVNTKEITPLKCHGQILIKLLQEKLGG